MNSSPDRKSLAKKLAKSEKDLQAFVYSFSDLAVIVDEEGQYEEILTPDHDLLYAPREEVLGKNVEEVLPEKVAGPFLELLEEVLRKNQPDRMEYPLEIDGGTHWFRAWLNPYRRKEGTEKLVATSIREITEQKKREKKLQRMRFTVQSAAEAIARANMEGILKYVNSSFLDLLGYENQEEVIGKHVAEFNFDEKKAKEVIDLIREEGNWSGEIELERKDGSAFFAHASASILRNEKGEPLELLSSFVDISDRKEAKKELKRERAKLKNLHRAVDLLQQEDTEEDLLETAVEITENVLDFHICGIMLLRGDRLVSEALSRRKV